MAVSDGKCGKHITSITNTFYTSYCNFTVLVESPNLQPINIPCMDLGLLFKVILLYISNSMVNESP